jgi:mono/diheme cytochrome c family protein
VLARPLLLTALLAAAPAVAEDGGASAWKQHCAKCHGDAGAADTPAAKAMKAPALVGDRKLAAMGSAEIVQLIRASPKHGALALSDDDLAAAAGHAKQLAGEK